MAGKNGQNGKRKVEIEAAVRRRYAKAAAAAASELCCPVSYDKKYLEILPKEIIERDYGCGDPSRYLAAGQTVLDLGCGGGKICYIAAQVVGKNGRVIGVDFNEPMLALARKHQKKIGDRLGYHNVQFRRGRIQDLTLDLDLLDDHLAAHPVSSTADYFSLEDHADVLRNSSPLIENESVDVIVSNCVLNLVRPSDKEDLFAEMHRVLRRGGRAVISDIVSDEDIPASVQRDPKLWSGCIGGAFREDQFLEVFERAGFYGVEIVERVTQPWVTLQGIEFRSITVSAYKGKEGSCLERNQAVIYKGPWRSVTDDDGHTLRRGKRMAVCDKTFQIYSRAPYAEHIEPVPPRKAVALNAAAPFDCNGSGYRHPRETKGKRYQQTRMAPAEACCGPDGC